MAFLNWDNYYDAYGKRFNEQRERFGILKIPEDWVATEKGTTTKLWKPKNVKEIKKGRLGKEVLINDSGKIFLERDRIVNKTQDKDEAIEVSCQFNEESTFIYKHFEFKDNSLVKEKILTKSEFEKIAFEWGVELPSRQK